MFLKVNINFYFIYFIFFEGLWLWTEWCWRWWTIKLFLTWQEVVFHLLTTSSFLPSLWPSLSSRTLRLQPVWTRWPWDDLQTPETFTADQYSLWLGPPPPPPLPSLFRHKLQLRDYEKKLRPEHYLFLLAFFVALAVTTAIEVTLTTK